MIRKLIIVLIVFLSACSPYMSLSSEQMTQTAVAKNLTATARPTIESGDLDLQVVCVVSTTYSEGKLNVHKTKDSKSDVIVSIKEGEKVRVTKIDGEWLFLEDSMEESGRINREYIYAIKFAGWVKSQYCIVQD